MKKFTLLKSLLLTAILLVGSGSVFGQTVTIFSENMGNPTANTLVANHTFQNSGTLTFTGVGGVDVRTTQASTGYSGASGGGNVFFGTGNNGGVERQFEISGINTSAHKDLVLSFGIRSMVGNDGSSFVVEVSADGTTYTALTFDPLPDAAGWTHVTLSGTIPSTENLRIRFRQAVVAEHRLDDVLLVGVLAEEPAVASPTFLPAPLPIHFEPVNVTLATTTAGATIRFTTDGSTPDENSTVFTTPITVSTTTIINAIAISAGVSSAVASRTYTFPVSVPNIAAFKAANTATNPTVFKIEGDVTFVFRNARNIFVKDETGGLVIFDSAGANSVVTNSYNEGDIISGGIIGTYNLFNGLHQLIPVRTPAVGTAGTPVTPIELTIAELLADFEKYMSQLVRLTDVSTVGGTFGTGAQGSIDIFQDTDMMIVRNHFGTFTGDVLKNSEEDDVTYNITGFAIPFNAERQIAPRTRSDIVERTTVPTIIVAEESIPTMSARVGRTATRTITVSGMNLTGNIAITIDGANSNLFSVSPNSITTPASGEVAVTTVTITYAPTADNGNHTATLRLNSTGAQEVSFVLNGTVSPELPDVIIVEVYGGGGNTGATFNHKFVTLFNTTTENVDISGWSLQYLAAATIGQASANNTFVFPPNTIIAAEDYFLIQLRGGENGADLPTPNLIDNRENNVGAPISINPSATQGKFILFRTSDRPTFTEDVTSITGNPHFQDYVPYGITAVPVWGSILGNLSNTTSAQRRMVNGEYVHTQNVGNDFMIATPNPRAGQNIQVSVETPTKNALNIFARDGQIMFNVSEGKVVEVYNVLGQMITSQLTTEGLNTVSVNMRGIAIVRVGNQTVKVRL